MQAYTLFRTQRYPNRDATVDEWSGDGSDLPALDAEMQETLDGLAVAYGTAAVRVEQETREVFVTDQDGSVNVSAVRTETLDEVATDYLALPSEGIVGVERSTGAESVAELVAHNWSPTPVTSHLDLEGFVDEIQDGSNATVEMVTAATYSDDRDPEEDAPDSTQVDWGESAALDDGGARELSGVAFSFESDECGHVRGVAYASGYLGLWNTGNENAYGSFVNTHVDEHLRAVGEDDVLDLRADQQELGEQV